MPGPLPRRRPSRLRADFSGDERGVSEVLGNVILIAMTVTMLGAFGATVMSTVSSDTPKPPAATFTLEPVPGDAFVDIRLVSGSSFAIDDTFLLFQANGSDAAGGYYVTNAATPGRWAPGETLRMNLSSGTLQSTGRLMLMVIDENSHKTAGTAYATVPGATTGETLLRNDISATLSFDRAPLTADGATTANASVSVGSTLGIILIDSVVLNLSNVGGPGALPLADDGVAPDEIANDGLYSARLTVGNYTFSSLPGFANQTAEVTVRDMFGDTATATATLFLASPPVSKVGAGTTFRNVGSSGIISTDGFLNLSSFTFRDTGALNNDQIEVRVSDLNDPSIAWSALVSFANTGCPSPSVTSIVLRRDGVTGNVTYTPATGCFPVDVDARLNLANVVSSLDASSGTATWTAVGTEATYQYSAAGVGTSNEALIAYFGDAVSPSPFLTGLGQTDLTWAPPDESGPATAPSAITDLAATPGNTYVDLTWSAPATGGSAITGYAIYRNGVLLDTIGTNTSYRSAGLTNGVAYTFTVRAINAVGTASDSNSVIATPVAVPSAPLAFTAEPAIQRGYLNWSAPATDGGSAITAYRIYLNGTLHATIGTNTSFVALGLVHNTTYSWEIAAVTSAGEGAKTSATVLTTPGEPLAPTSLSATAGSTQVSLSWSAASANGRAVTGYKIFRDGVLLDTIGTNTSYVSAGLTNGVLYTYTVSAINEVGEGPQSSAASATPATLPSAPTAFTAESAVARAYLNWSAPATDGGSTITGYAIYRNGTLYATIGSNTSFVALGLEHNSTYSWEIAAINANGEGAKTSATPATTPGVPYAPTGLSGTPGNGQVALTWNAATANGRPVTAYRVYVDGVLRDTIGTNTSYIVAGLTNGVSYTFTVSAVNEVGAGPQSAGETATPALGATVPGAPTSFVPTLGNRSAALTWSAPASDGGTPVIAYRIYRNGTFLQQIGTNTSYTAAGLVNNVSYTFEVSAVNLVGEGDKAGPTAITPGSIPFPPASVGASAGNRTVTLTWALPADDGGRALSAFQIYNASSSALIATTASGANTSFTVNGLANGTAYSFYMVATNALGSSAASNTASATPAGASFPPTGLAATAGNSSAALTWTAPTNNGGSSLTGYGIYRGTSTSSLALIATIGTNTSFTANSLTNGTTYFFAVSAINAQGASSMSAAASATPAGAPFPPTSLAASSSNASVALSWTIPSNNGGSALTTFQIYNATSGALIASTGSGANTSFTVNSLTNGYAYSFRVVAVNAIGPSSASNTASATPLSVPYPPANFAVTTSAAQLNLTWSAGQNGGSAITAYQIYRNGTLLTTIGTNTSYQDLNVLDSVTYTYAVRAVNAVGTSNPTATLTMTAGGALTQIDCGAFSQGSGGTFDSTLCTSLTIADGTYADLREGTGNPKLFNVTFSVNVASVTGTTHELQAYGYQQTSPEILHFQVFNGTLNGWQTITSLPTSATSTPGTLVFGAIYPAHHFVAGTFQIRIIDDNTLNGGSDSPLTHWFMDYVRLVSR